MEDLNSLPEVPDPPSEDIVVEMDSMAGRWQENTWYKVPFDCIISVQATGQDVYAHAELNIYLYGNSKKVEKRAQHRACADKMNGLRGEYWKEAYTSFTVPIYANEQFNIRRNNYSPKPSWLNTLIEVIPYPPPYND